MLAAGLYGRSGLEPVAVHLARTAPFPAALPNFLRRPSLLLFHAALGLDVDAALDLVAVVGGAAAAAAAAGGATAPLLAAAWLCYLSLVNVGQTFLSFQWRAARPGPGASVPPRGNPAWARMPREGPRMEPRSRSAATRQPRRSWRLPDRASSGPFEAGRDFKRLSAVTSAAASAGRVLMTDVP